MENAYRVPVANRFIPTLPRLKGPTRIEKPIAEANSLLAALPRKVREHLHGNFEKVALTYGEVLYEPGEQIKYVYFPNDSIVSLLTLVDQHQALEVGLVGREGMVGIPLAMEIAISPVRALVQGTGDSHAHEDRSLSQGAPAKPLIAARAAPLHLQFDDADHPDGRVQSLSRRRSAP